MRTAITHARRTAARRVPVDGRRWVSIRPIERADVAGLSAFYKRLSRESRRRRFLGDVVAVDGRLLTEFASPNDGVVGVLREPGPDDGSIVAHASVQAAGDGGAEVAFAVADDLHGLGLGRALVGAAIELARARGFDRVSASLYAENAPMRRLLRGAGCEITRDTIAGGVEEIELRVAA